MNELMDTGKGSKSPEGVFINNQRVTGPKTLPSSSHREDQLGQWSGSGMQAPHQCFHLLFLLPITLSIGFPLLLALPCLPLHCHYIIVIRSQQIRTLLLAFS